MTSKQYGKNVVVVPLIGGSGDTLNPAATEYCTLSGSIAPTATETAVAQLIGRKVTLRNFRVRLSAAPNGAGKSYAFTVRKDAANTALTVTLTNTETTKEDLTHAVTFEFDDTVSIGIVPANSPDAVYGYWNCEAHIIKR